MKKEFFKFVFLGAGSSVFTMRLVGDILKEDTIKKGHIALVDLDEKLLRETEEAVKELVAFSVFLVFDAVFQKQCGNYEYTDNIFPIRMDRIRI